MTRSAMSRAGLVLLALASTLPAQQVTAAAPALHWRWIGPLRGGRTRAAAGVPNQPYTFYMAQVNGCVGTTTTARSSGEQTSDLQSLTPFVFRHMLAINNAM